MARMIPAFYDEKTPPGEQDVFNMLSNGPASWVVLHSLDLAPWNNNRRTEVDFVILIPDTGIYCLEVKSQKQITFENDRWHPSEIRRSPFKQAQDGSKAFYRGLRHLEPRFRNFPVTHLCVFPYSNFYIGDVLSVSEWELIDAKLFQQFRTSHDFCTEIKHRLSTAIKKDPDLRPSTHPLSPSQLDLLINRCIPVQKHNPDTRAEIEHRQIEMDKLLHDQQKPVLQLAELNSTLVVAGAAGTGKTLIAIETALHAAHAGQRVGLFCFNRLIGNWMKQKVNTISPIFPNLIVGRVFQVLADMCRIEIPDRPTQEYWDKVFPEQLEDNLTNPDFRLSAVFDCLIIDEAQDLLSRPRLWDSVVSFLDGDIEDSSIVLFGDFEHQVLGRRQIMEATLGKFYNVAMPVRYRLDENCRNYEIIGQTAIKLTGFGDEVYSNYLRPGGSLENYRIQFYEDKADQQVLLKKNIADFIGRGYKPSEITVLSFCSPENSAAAQLSKVDHKLLPAGTSDKHTTYSSINAFKGLENKIIILTDAHPGDHDFSRDLFYTGMTRSTDTVCVLCPLDAQQILSKWLSEDNKL